MGTETKYRVRNWADYNRSLVQRGNITVWFSEDAQVKWVANQPRKPGRPAIYSDDAILTALVIRCVFSLPLRALEGFLASLVSLIDLDLPVPSYTQICRRAQSLGKQVKRLSSKRVTDLVIDSTGLKVYGEGEWKVRQHGPAKRRTWRKLHLAICPNSHEIVFVKLTDNKTLDHHVFPEFLQKAPKTIERAYGDGAYDKSACYQASFEKGCKSIIPPQKNARYRANAPEYFQERNHAVLEIHGLGGDSQARKLWKKLKGYHLRSLAETAMFRFKTFFGGRMQSRTFSAQQAEVCAKSIALNKFTRLGMPITEKVAA